jgi:hypothetical protein
MNKETNKQLYKSAVDEIKVDNRLLAETALRMMEIRKAGNETGNGKFDGNSKFSENNRYSDSDSNMKNNDNNDKSRNSSEDIRKSKSRYGGTYKYGILAACAVIMVVSVFFLKDKFNQSPIAKQPIAISSIYPAALKPNMTIALAEGKGKLYINEVEGVRPNKLRLPEGAYSKDLSMSELQQYFGRNPIPVIPTGFKQAGDTTNITFHADGSIFYMYGIQLIKDINDIKSPNMVIQINKGSMPLNDCFYKGDVEKESTIGTTKLIIGALKMGEDYSEQGVPASYYDVYYSQFMYEGIGYNISAERVSVDAFIELLEGIILK